MKKNMRTLIILLAVLVVVGGGAAALLLTQPQAQEDDTSSTSSTTTETVVDRDAEQITSVSVQNATDSFTMVPLEDDDSATPRFTIEGYENYNLNIDAVSTSAQSVASVTASKNLGEVEDLEAFGLSGEGAATITAQYADGSTDQLVVGSQAGESVGRYVLKDGVVYISTSVSSNLLESPLGFINTDLYEVEDRTEQVENEEGEMEETTLADVLYHIEFSGTHLSAPIVIDYDETVVSGYRISQPVTAESGSNTFNEIVTALKSLTASSVAALGRTPENLEAYGLAEPYAQISFDLNGQEHTLAVSEAGSDGTRYLLYDDADLIYTVADDSVSLWAEAQLMDLRMSYVWLANINEAQHVTLTAGGKEYRFDVEREVDQDRTTEQRTYYDLTISNGEGEQIDYDSSYQPFYQEVLSIAVLSVEDVVYDGAAPLLEITYQYFEGGSDTVAFCPVEGQDERCAAVLNGEYNGLVRKSSVQNVISLLEQVYENQAIED